MKPIHWHIGRLQAVVEGDFIADLQALQDEIESLQAQVNFWKGEEAARGIEVGLLLEKLANIMADLRGIKV